MTPIATSARAHAERRAALCRLRRANPGPGHGRQRSFQHRYQRRLRRRMRTGAINVFRSTDTPTAFTPTTTGQTVEAVGRIELRWADGCASTSRIGREDGVALRHTPSCRPRPVARAADDDDRATSTATPESFEGQLVSIANVSIVERNAFRPSPQSLDAFVDRQRRHGHLRR